MPCLRRLLTFPIASDGEAPNHQENLLAWTILAAAVSLLGVFYFKNTGILIEINDEAGYLYAGSRIVTTGLPAHDHPYNEQIGPYFTLSAMRVRRPGDPRFYLIYPPGYPLLIALAQRLPGGWEQARFYVTPFLALVAALGAFGLGQNLAAPRVGLWAALLLLLDPAVIRNGTRAFSDVPALACVLLGYAALLGPGRASWRRGVASGLCLGYACLIRQAGVVALAGVPVWLILDRAHWRAHRAFWLSLGVSLGVCGVAVLTYNAAVFGGPLTTGYALQHHWIPFPAFSWQNFLGHSAIRPGGYRSVWEAILQDLGMLGLLAAGLGLLVAPRRVAVTLGTPALAVAFIHAFYAWPATDSDGRFLLPVFAILRLFAALGLAWLLSVLRVRRPVALVIGAALFVLWQGQTGREIFAEVQRRAEGTATRVAYVETVAAKTAPASVFISRLYGDHFILYGGRTALLLDLLVTREPGRYREEEFAPTLTRAVQGLLERGVSVYVVADGMAGTRAGFFDPLPVLEAEFQLSLLPDLAPPIYLVQTRGR